MSVVAVQRREPSQMLVPLAIATVAFRPAGWWATAWVIVAAGMVVGVASPPTVSLPRRWPVAVAAGCVVFAVVPLLWRGPSASRVGALGVVASVVAAVAEEFVFRRSLYGVLQERGEAMAVVASAALFALAHVPSYGWGVVPIDFAAGLIFAWQRHVTGSWTAPAATHSFANLVQVL